MTAVGFLLLIIAFLMVSFKASERKIGYVAMLGIILVTLGIVKYLWLNFP